MAQRQLRGLRGRRLLLEPVFVRKPFLLLVELENRRRGKRLGFKVKDQGPHHQAGWFVAKMRGKEIRTFQKELEFPCRGRYLWGPLWAQSGYPLGLVRRTRMLVAGQEVIVLPSLGQLQRGVLRRLLTQSSPTLGMAAGKPRRHRAAQTEFHGLRDYQTGDSTRWIHWRTSARRGQLMVREFEEMPSDSLVIIVEPWLPKTSDVSKTAQVSCGDKRDVGSAQAGARPEDHLETAISLAATICWEWCRQKGDRLVLAVAGEKPALVAGVTGQDLALAMLECLAVQTGCVRTDVALLVDRLQDSDMPPGPVLLVTTHGGDLEEELGRALHHPIACVNIADGGHRDFFEMIPTRSAGEG